MKIEVDRYKCTLENDVVYIERRGDDFWAITQAGSFLNKEGKWVKRIHLFQEDEETIKNHFYTLEEAKEKVFLLGEDAS